MTVKDAIKTVKVMLGQVEEFEHTPDHKEEEKVSMAQATLVDGTIVETEGELEVGKALRVVTEGEEEVLAPSGKHETTEGLLITVGEAGMIESIEEITAEESEEKEEEEVAMEEEDKKVEEAFDAEGLLEAIADMIKDYQSYVEEVKEELSQLTERFNEVADMPAAKTVKKTFFEEAKAAKEVAGSRFNRLASLRRQNLTK